MRPILAAYAVAVCDAGGYTGLHYRAADLAAARASAAHGIGYAAGHYGRPAATFHALVCDQRGAVVERIEAQA